MKFNLKMFNMEYDLKISKWETTSKMEDDLRNAKWKTTKKFEMEEEKNEDY